MQKRLFVLISFLLIVAAGLSPSSGFAQSPGAPVSGNTLSGVVKDSASGKPLAGVSVFLNSTSRGTVTHNDGTFTLSGIPPGGYELIISAIGYATFVMTINTRNLPPPMKVTLHNKASELEAVVVEPYLKDGWKKWGKFFFDNFIGTTENAADCKLKNKEVLRFHYYLKSRRLSVTAVEPLIIENKALGYDLQYRLENFSCDFSTNIISYFGYPYFQEMTADNSDRQLRWEKARQHAYLGSMVHFMRSLYKDSLQHEGFIVEHEIQVPNVEKLRVKSLYTPNVTKTDSIPIDTLHHYWEILRQPDYYTQKVRSFDSIATVNPDRTRSFYFTGDFTVIYGNGHLGIAYAESAMEMMYPTPITIEENGAYFPPQTLLSKGNWAKTEKIANLVPRDYEPPPMQQSIMEPH